jgi:hypothetical protein
VDDHHLGADRIVSYEVRPVEGQDYEGRQYGYEIWRLPDEGEDFVPYAEWTATTGSTGPCWNIDDVRPDVPGEEPSVPLHVCDLEGFIDALQALRDSEADAELQRGWS